jgi:hypothetical protein
MVSFSLFNMIVIFSSLPTWKGAPGYGCKIEDTKLPLYVEPKTSILLAGVPPGTSWEKEMLFLAPRGGVAHVAARLWAALRPTAVRPSDKLPCHHCHCHPLHLHVHRPSCGRWYHGRPLDRRRPRSGRWQGHNLLHHGLLTHAPLFLGNAIVDGDLLMSWPCTKMSR